MSLLLSFGCGGTTSTNAGDASSDGGASSDGAGGSTGAPMTDAGSTNTTGSVSAGGVVGSLSSGGGSLATSGSGGSGPSVQCDPPEFASPEQWASRIERLFWGSDDGVLAGALATGELTLSSAEDVQREALNLLEDAERGRVGLPLFVKQWLELDDESQLDISEEMLASTIESTDRTIEAMIFETVEPLSVFYSGDWAVVDEPLAEYYGVEPPDSEWGVVTLPEPRHVGLLGQHFWLNATAHPARRGTVLAESLRCQTIPSAPPGLGPPRDDASADLTRREAYLAAVSSAACYGCHALIAPLGLPFEHFDAWGDFRTEDNGFVVDASGGIPGTNVEVADAPELGEALAGQLALETEHCVARQVVAYSLGEPVALRSSIFDEPECFQRLNVDLAELRSASFVEWLVELVGSPIFLSEYPE